MADPKPICSGTANAQSIAVEGHAAEEETAHQSLSLPQGTASDGENAPSTYTSATPVAPKTDNASGIQRSAQLFSSSVQRVNPKNIKTFVASLGFDPALLLGNWKTADNGNFHPDGINLIPSAADSRNVTKFVDQNTLFSVNLTYPNVSQKDLTVTVNYQGYEPEIPVQVVELQNGSRLHVLGGKFKGVFLYQYGAQLGYMKIVSANELLSGIAQDLHLQPLTLRGSRSDNEAKAAAETQRKENRLPTVFSEDGVLPSRENNKAIKDRAAVVDLLSKNSSLVSTLEPLLATEVLRPGIARLLIKISATEGHPIPEELPSLSAMVAAGNIQEAVDTLEGMISEKSNRAGSSRAGGSKPATTERPSRPPRPTRESRPAAASTAENPPVVVKNPISLDQIIPQRPKPTDDVSGYLEVEVSDGKSTTSQKARLKLESAEEVTKSQNRNEWQVEEVYTLAVEGGATVQFTLSRQALLVVAPEGGEAIEKRNSRSTVKNSQASLLGEGGESSTTQMRKLLNGNFEITIGNKKIILDSTKINNLATSGNVDKKPKVRKITRARIISEGEMIPKKTTERIKIKIWNSNRAIDAEIQLVNAELLNKENARIDWKIRETYLLVIGEHEFTFTVERPVVYKSSNKGVALERLGLQLARQAVSITYKNNQLDSLTHTVTLGTNDRRLKINVQLADSTAASIQIPFKFLAQLTTLGTIPEGTKSLSLEGNLPAANQATAPEDPKDKVDQPENTKTAEELRAEKEARRIAWEELQKRIVPHTDTEPFPMVIELENGKKRNAWIQLNNAELQNYLLPLKQWKVRETYTLYLEGETSPIIFEISRNAMHQRGGRWVVNYHYHPEAAIDTALNANEEIEISSGARAAFIQLSLRGGSLNIPASILTQLSSNGTLKSPASASARGLNIQETEYLPVAIQVSDEKTEMREIRLASANVESVQYDGKTKEVIREIFMIRNPADGSILEFETTRFIENLENERSLGFNNLWYQEGERENAQRFQSIGFDRSSDILFIRQHENELQIPRALLNSVASQGNTDSYSLKMTLSYEAKKAEQIDKFITEERMIPHKTTDFITTKANLATGDPLPIASIKLGWASFTPIAEGQSLNTVEVSETYQVELLTGYRFTFTIIREVTFSLDQPGGEIRTTSRYKLPTESNANFSTKDARKTFPTLTNPVRLSLEEGSNHLQLRFKLSPSDSEKTLSIPTNSLKEIATKGALSFEEHQPLIFESASPTALEVRQCIGQKGVFILEDPYNTKPFVIPTPITYNLKSPQGSAGLHRTVATQLGIDPADLRPQGKLLSQIFYQDADKRMILNSQEPYRSFKLGNLTLNGTYEALLPSTTLPTLLGAEATYRGIPIETVAIYNVQTVAGSGFTPIRQYVLVQSPSGQKLLFYRNLIPGINVDPQLLVISSEDKITKFDQEMAKQYSQINLLKSDINRELKRLKPKVDRDVILRGIENAARGSKDKFLQSRLNTLFTIFGSEQELYREAALLFSQDYAASETSSHPLLNVDQFLKDRLPTELQRKGIIEKKKAESLRKQFSEDKKWEVQAIKKFFELEKEK